MFLDKKDAWDQLSALWQDPSIPTLDLGAHKFALISDLHLGDGGEADDFWDNLAALERALDHYLARAYTLLLLGDIEEFWQFDLPAIQARYDESIYARMRAFGEARLWRIFGNHDHEWAGLVDPTRSPAGQARNHFAPPAIKLKDASGASRILLVHGHQGTLDSDKYAWFSRFAARLFRGIEPYARAVGLYSPTASTKSPIARDYERTLYQWAKASKVLLVCGHSHRAIFASHSYGEKLETQVAQLKAENSLSKTSKRKRVENLEQISQLQRRIADERDKGRLIEPTEPSGQPLPCYFNTGCGIYSDGLTALEIEDDEIRLVKWGRSSLAPPYYEIYDRGKLSDFIQQVIA
ncbi:MAG: metallophosphoesterase [Chloroflexota bacterium]